MERADATPRAVLYSALLHLGIVAFLALATLNCTHWEDVFNFLHLPSPVTCTRPLQLAGPVIEATLVGPVGAPPPPASRHRQATPPPQPKVAPRFEPPKPAPVKVLPPPVQRPDIKDQEKIAELAQQAELAKQQQEQREKQRMAELARQQEAERLLKELAKVKAESAATERQIRLEQQKAQQLADLRKTSETQTPQNVPPASQAMTGQAGKDNAAYIAALQNAVTQNWLRPDNIPAGAVCPVEIVQIPGGQVISAKALPSCPFNDIGKHSVEAAIERSSPLPYKGFEKEFQRDIIFNFTVTSSQ